MVALSEDLITWEKAGPVFCGLSYVGQARRAWNFRISEKGGTWHWEGFNSETLDQVRSFDAYATPEDAMAAVERIFRLRQEQEA